MLINFLHTVIHRPRLLGLSGARRNTRTTQGVIMKGITLFTFTVCFLGTRPRTVLRIPIQSSQ
jgi:hypothetical protein